MNSAIFSARLFLVLFLLRVSAGAGEVVQIDVSETFNMRPISTVVGGKLVPLNNNIDGAGGVATTSAAAALGVQDPHAMPDDGKFPATDRHPEVVLSYATDDGKKNLARRSQGGDAFLFTVPPKNYSNLFLFFASGQGPSQVRIRMKYTDGSVDVRQMEVPDWFWELKPDDKDRCYLATDLSKWGPDKKLEDNHHFIFALNVHPDAAKTLAKVLVEKSQPGLMAFFGATGETAN